ncbi:hypothetical protein G7Y89_g4083 [Cudoniella acicularis]|uniref:Polyketide synthase n=1 Tax=Cudoniella acicularis TaxID=354080 RepID=A0A8H4RT43_9HELO|nr:hypothetical protein G7Y89_g4083 [Cudoniella acicularis]
MSIKEPIAIIGSSCRFPGGCTTPARLWELLQDPHDILKEIPPNRFNAESFYHQDASHHGTSNVDKAYLLSENISLFDASFFNISPREAAAMDPQQRLLLETVYEAIENAGYSLQKLSGSNTSVFVGLMGGDYHDIQSRDPTSVSQYLATGTARSVLSNRISYFFDWRGPSMTIDTACSSSLVSVHLAVQGLRNGESSMAVVGGANLILGPEPFIYEFKLHMLSPRGRSSMWDSSADGYGRGEGFATVVLKPLGAALRDGDHIESVIRETGVAQDGRTSGITMPSSSSQAALIKETYLKAGLDLHDPVDRCQFFEAHGTGAPAGDPIEAEAIQKAFFPVDKIITKEDFLLVGSIKTVIGHLEGTAGLAGLMKASLAVQRAAIPRNLLFNDLNPTVAPFCEHLRIPLCTIPWPKITSGVPRRVSVNSFGFGGTNAHAIIESFDPLSATPRVPIQSSPAIPSLPLCLSANSLDSLINTVELFSTYLRSFKGNLGNLVWTLFERRTVLPQRISFSGSNTKDLSAEMEKMVALARWPGMAGSLITKSAIFAESIKRLDQILAKLPDGPSWTLEDQLQARADKSRMGEASISQPCCTALQISLVDIAHQAGISFNKIIGHSSGEIAAAYAAGLISAADAIKIAYYRGLYAKLARGTSGENGAMMAIGYSYDQAMVFCQQDQYEGRIAVAASNGPMNSTVSGDLDAIEEAKEQLDSEGIMAKILMVNTAYHSHHMNPCEAPYLKSLRACHITPNTSKESCMWISTVYDSSKNAQNIIRTMKDSYWKDNMINPVLFTQGVQQALESTGPFDFVLEIGPHPALKRPTVDTIKAHTGSPVPYEGLLRRDVEDLEALSAAVGHMWTHLGPASLNIRGYLQVVSCDIMAKPCVIPGLPTYPWSHDVPFWNESRISRQYRLRTDPVHELLGSRTAEDNEKNMRWRNILRIDEIPWVRGHCFQKQVLFPATAYICIALDASCTMVKGAVPRLAELSDLKISKAITLDEDSSGVETLFSLVQEDSGFDDRGRFVTARFVLYAGENPVGMQEHFSGKVRLELGDISSTILPPRIKSSLEPSETDVDRFYEELSNMGLEYSGSFRGINSIKRCMDIACVTVSKTNPACGSRGSKSVLHPGFLDTCLQTLFAAFCAPGDGNLWAPYLPTTIGKIKFNIGLLLRDKSSTGVVNSYVSQRSSQAVVGDVEVFDGDGNMHIQIQRLSCSSLSKFTAINDRTLSWKTCWKADVLEEHFGQRTSPQTQGKIMTICERASHFFLKNLRKLIPHEQDADLEWHFRQLLKFVDHHLLDVANGNNNTVLAEWAEDSEGSVILQLKDCMGQVEAELIQAIGPNLVAIVNKQKNLLEILQQNSMLDRLYQEGFGFGEANGHVSKTVAQISHQYPHLRILEIGAGTGGTTLSVLKGLNNKFGSYHFTDISAAFLERARSKFAALGERIIYMKLDIENDTTNQGFENQSFDLIIASNVLHATRILKTTMINVRRLLRPGGFLLLMEVTGKHLMNTLIMSGLPGWWLGKDDGRIYAPTIPSVQWNRILEQTGFSGTDRIQENATLSVILTQAIDATVEAFRKPLMFKEMIPVPKKLVLVGGKTLRSAKVLGEIQKLLKGWFDKIENPSRVEDIDFTTKSFATMATLCVTDFDEPFFQVLSARRLKALQILLEKSRHLLWATSNCRSGNPLSNMMIGLARSIQSEMSHFSFQTLDFEDLGEEVPASRTALHLVNHMLRMFLSSSAKLTHNLMWTTEPELLIRGDILMIPRIIANTELNNRLNSSRRPITEVCALSTSAIEVRLKEDNETWFFRKVSIMLGIPVVKPLLTIRVKYSLLYSIRVFGNTYLFPCYGKIISTGENVLCLSRSNASIVALSDSWLIKCQCSDKDTLQRFSAFTSNLIARNILESGSDTGTTAIHEAGYDLKQTLLYNNKATGGQRKLLFVEREKCPNGDRDSINIHPNASMRELREAFPQNFRTFFECSSSQEVVDLVAIAFPKVCVHTPSWIFAAEPKICPKYDSTVLQTLLPADRFFYDSGLHRESRLTSTSILTASMDKQHHKTILSWQTDEKVSITINPLDPRALFSAFKTYFLVGLTGDLGRSLAGWMILHGARYIVLASRNPQIPDRWLTEMERGGATIKVSNLDVTNRDQVKALYDDVTCSFPPVAGIANAAMVLSDNTFAEMSIAQMEKAIGPKVLGTQHLDELFAHTKLDFFILFSSLACIVGNPGQSNYNAANMFMVSLARKRRERGVVASVIDIGMLIGLGYVSKTGTRYETPLRRLNFMPISEPEFHNIFAEAIHAGQSNCLDDSELIVGLQEVMDSQKESPLWHENPRFSHLVQIKTDGNRPETAKDCGLSVGGQVGSASSTEEALRLLKAAFLERLGVLLRMKVEQISHHSSLTAMGIDSLIAIDIRSWFLKELKVDIPVFKILAGVTVEDLCSESISGLTMDRLRRKRDHTHLIMESSPKNKLGQSTIDSPGADLTTTADRKNIATDRPTSWASSLDGTDSTSVAMEEDDLTLRPSNVQETLLIKGLYEKTLPLASCQSTFWFLKNYLKDLSSYNIAVHYTLRGNLDRSKFEVAFQTVIQKHEILRTAFINDLDSGESVQGILPVSNFQLKCQSVTTDAQLSQEFNRIKGIEFHLENGHTMEAVLVTQSTGLQHLMFCYHHIIMDGMSWRVFLRELNLAYASPPLQLAQCQFSDFVEKEKLMIQENEFRSDLEYWEKEFTTLPEPLPLLPMSKINGRLHANAYNTGNVCLDLRTDLAPRIKKTSMLLNTTPYQLYLSAFQLLLFQLTGTEDLCIGVADANRSNERFIDTIGCFVNTLPLRLKINSNEESFTTLLSNTGKKVSGAMAHSALPFNVLLDALRLPRCESHPPLFQVLLNYRLGAIEASNIGDCTLIPLKSRAPMAPYDLTLSILESSSGHCRLEFDFQKNLYTAEGTTKLLECYSHLLDSICRHPSTKINKFELCSKWSIGESLRLGKGLRVEADQAKTVSHLFEQEVAHHPKLTAMRDGYGASLSYEASLELTSRISATISSIVPTESPIAMLCEPSVEAVCSMLAIARMNALCLPLDLSIPFMAVKSILVEAKPQLLIYHDHTLEMAAKFKELGITMINISKSNMEIQSTFILAKPSSGVLSLYTSGTTGTPKGVILTHENLLNSILGMLAVFKMDVEVILQQSSLGFDLAWAQIFLALCSGSTLIIARREQRGDPTELSTLIFKENVSFTFCVPSEYSILLRYSFKILKACSSWRMAWIGGERLTKEIKKQFQHLRPDVVLFNGYGPTETSIVSHMGKVHFSEIDDTNPEEYEPIGRPLQNVSTYIIDKNGRLLPLGFSGEICIGGKGVSSGYTNDRMLTEKKFLPNTFTDQNEEISKLYKTGDKGKLLEDGSLVYLGRIEEDNQIKLRGQRIELNGVENAILTTAMGNLTEVVVLAQGQTTEAQILVGFVTFAGTAVIDTSSEGYLQTVVERLPLPRYMWPAYLISLDRLPRTPNGKVDRNALRTITIPFHQKSSEMLESHSNVEELLKSLWRDAISVTRSTVLPIYRTSDFFELGGNSISMAGLQYSIRNTFNVTIQLSDLFMASSLQRMAAQIETRNGDTGIPKSIDWTSETCLQPELYKLTEDSLKIGNIVRSVQRDNRETEVLLTGAFGFLGKRMLQLLVDDPNIKKVHCVAIRPRPGFPPRDSPIASEKIVVYPGDLSDANLGLSAIDWRTLSGSIDVIIHNGSEVSFLKSYTTLRNANVGSTNQLIKLCLPRRISLLYISSAGIAALLGENCTLEETHTPSKWVSERLLEAVTELVPIKIRIHRPAYIVGEGASATDLVSTVFDFSIKMGAVPILSGWSGHFNLVSADEVAREVLRNIHNSNEELRGLEIRHHTGDVSVAVGELKSYLELQHSITCESIPLQRWIAEAEKAGMSVAVAGYLKQLIGRGSHVYPTLLSEEKFFPPGTLKQR